MKSGSYDYCSIWFEGVFDWKIACAKKKFADFTLFFM